MLFALCSEAGEQGDDEAGSARSPGERRQRARRMESCSDEGNSKLPWKSASPSVAFVTNAAKPKGCLIPVPFRQFFFCCKVSVLTSVELLLIYTLGSERGARHTG